MSSQEVHELLHSMGLPDKADPYGFPLGNGFRVECGSGIAGRGNYWRIVDIKTGKSTCTATMTRSGLKMSLEALEAPHKNRV